MEHLLSMTDRECADLFAELRWPEGFACACGHRGSYRLRARPRVFGCNRCKTQTSVTAGTALHRTRVPLCYWLVAVELMAREDGVSAAELQRLLCVSYETAWQMLHRLRRCLEAGQLALRGPLSRSGSAVRVKAPRKHASHLITLVRGATCSRLVAGRIDQLWCDRHAPGCQLPEKVLGELFLAAYRARTRLHHCHHGVSERWLHRYLAEIAVVHDRHSPRRILGTALRTLAPVRFEAWCPEWPLPPSSRPFFLARL